MLFKKDYSHDLCQFFSVLQRHQVAGISAADSIKAYLQDCTNPDLKMLLQKISNDMTNGADLAMALSKHPEFCPAYVIELIKVGIQNSQLDKFIGEIVQSLEQDDDLRREVRGHLIGPAISFVLFTIAYVLLVFSSYLGCSVF